MLSLDQKKKKKEEEEAKGMQVHPPKTRTMLQTFFFFLLQRGHYVVASPKTRTLVLQAAAEGLTNAGVAFGRAGDRTFRESQDGENGPHDEQMDGSNECRRGDTSKDGRMERENGCECLDVFLEYESESTMIQKLRVHWSPRSRLAPTTHLQQRPPS
jgi:hypothetical protein